MASRDNRNEIDCVESERPKPEATAYGSLVDKMVATVASWPAEYQRSVDVHRSHRLHAERA